MTDVCVLYEKNVKSKLSFAILFKAAVHGARSYWLFFSNHSEIIDACMIGARILCKELLVEPNVLRTLPDLLIIFEHI